MIKILSAKYQLVDNPAIIAVAVILLGLGLNFATDILAAVLAVLIALYFWKNQELFILFLLLYLPFEELFLKLLPDSLYGPARYYWEACLFIYMLGIIVRNAGRGNILKLKLIDKLLIGFLIVWVVSTILNAVSPIDSIQILRNYIRYIPILYLVYDSRRKDMLIANATRILIVMSALQAAICIGQAIGNDYLMEMFRPREIVVGGKLIREEDIQAGSYHTRFTGSFSRNNDLGNYLSFGLCLIVALYTQGYRFAGRLLSLILIVAALILTSSRISWLAAYAGIGAILICIRHKYRLAYFAVPMLILVTLIIAAPAIDPEGIGEDFGIASRLFVVFSADYYETLRDAGRLYALFYVAPAVLQTSAFLGLGPGTFMPMSVEMQSERAFAKAGQLGLDELSTAYVHDMGYVAILTQAGLLGLVILIAVFLKIGVIAAASVKTMESSFHRSILLAAIGILIAVAVQNLACSNLMYRNQAMIIWLFCGMALSLSGKGKS